MWVLLFITFIIVGGASRHLARGFWLGLMNPKMYPAAPADGRFKLDMPGEPRPITLPGDGAMPVQGFESSRAMSNERYFINYTTTCLDDADTKNPQAILNAVIERELTGSTPKAKAKPDPKAKVNDKADPKAKDKAEPNANAKPDPKPDFDNKPTLQITTHDGYPALDAWQETNPTF